MAKAGSSGAELRHLALCYRTAGEYESAVADFLLAGPAASEPAFIAVPGARLASLRRAIGPRLRSGPASRRSATADEGAGATLAAGASLVAGATATTVFADMTELGGNPARIIPSLRSFIDSAAGGPVRIVGEPVWPGRSPAETTEAIRHEALINLAFANAPVAVLCPYDATGLPEPVIADAWRTHPEVLAGGQPEPSPMFAGDGFLPADSDGPLPAVPRDVSSAPYEEDLRAVRDLAADQARLAGLSRARAVDFVLAVSEVAANTLRHTGAGGTIRVWHTATELICQLDDTGYIADPLAGRRPPDHNHPGGQGLWLVNQVCDLVELRSGPAGTTIRLHMTTPAR
jgi:anti-sigma regulatory factor (Ser/Thr protein kinase)